MKAAIIFALIGISLCRGDEHFKCEKPMENQDPNNRNCLKMALEGSTGVRKSFGEVFCKYLNKKEAMKEQLYAKAKEELRNFTACIGCVPDKIAGTSPMVENVGFGVGAVAGEGLHNFAHILEAAGVSRPFASIVCFTLYPVFFSECLDKLLEEDPKELITFLRDRTCKTDEKKKKATIVANTMLHAGCITKDVLHTDIVEQLVKYLGIIGSEHVETLLGVIESIPGLGNIVNELGCLVKYFLTVEDPWKIIIINEGTNFNVNGE